MVKEDRRSAGVRLGETLNAPQAFAFRLPAATQHLKAGQKRALDLLAEAGHTGGPRRAQLTRKITKLGEPAKPAAE